MGVVEQKNELDKENIKKYTCLIFSVILEKDY